MIIGESVNPESYNIVNKIKDKTISEKMILIEKPTIDYTYSDLKKSKQYSNLSFHQHHHL